jgi:hypothetical protein
VIFSNSAFKVFNEGAGNPYIALTKSSPINLYIVFKSSTAADLITAFVC